MRAERLLEWTASDGGEPLSTSLDTVGAAARAFPEVIEDGVHFCGFASEKAFGAQSYLVVREGGNVLVDSPRFSRIEGDAPVPLADDLLVIPTPGHTRGSMCLLYRDRFLFTGDHLWRAESGDDLEASRSVCWYSWPEQCRSLARLLEHDFEWVLPGHGRRYRAGSTGEARRALGRLLAVAK